MPVDISDAFFLQLSMQAQMYNLSTMTGRRNSARDLARFFQDIQQELPVTATVEIGVHEAEFSRAMAKLSPALKIFAYEANPHVYARFLLDGEPAALGIRYEHRAVSDTDGSMPLHLCSRIGDQAEPVDGKRQSLLPRVDCATEHTDFMTPCARLDSLFGGEEFAEDVFSLWIDAEGSAGMVLDGAGAVLDRTLSLYVEVESRAKWAGQKLDRDILAFLLQRDFVPLLRDFQFRHQYNMVLARKDVLPLVERHLHTHLHSVVRGEMARSFNLVAVEQKHVPAPVVWPELPAVDSEERMWEAMARLPLLRAPRAEFDPKRTAVVCHATELAQAVAYYAERYSTLPALYVEGDVDEEARRACAPLSLLPFAALRAGLDIQLFFPQAKRPGLTSFPRMAQKLREKGIAVYGIEEYSLAALWGRGRKASWSSEDLRDIRENTNALADSFSRYTYLAVCKARMESEPGYMPIAGYPQYFHPLASVQPGDVLCEGGIDDGKSTRKFYEAMQGRGRIFAFEPVTRNFEISRESLLPYAPVVRPVQKALWSETGSIHVNVRPSASCSAFVSVDTGNAVCDCVSIDDFFADQGSVNCIKLDVEGAELPVLQGAVATLRRYRPRLMISIYHARNAHEYIYIPRRLRELDLGYCFYVGHHTAWLNETILYGVAKA